MSGDEEQSYRLCLRVSALEADLAYFEARLSLIGKPGNRHQAVQLKTYAALAESLRQLLGRLDQTPRAADGEGGEETE